MTTKEWLLADLINSGYLRTKAVVEAFKTIDRADFVLPETLTEAYENHPLPIGHGQTISQPLTVAFMLEQLEANLGEKILDVGCGSGWQTALLAQVVGKKGRVIGVERIFELAEMARQNLAKYPKLQNAKIIMADGSLGYAAEAPFDKIIAAAAATRIPPAWKEQLKVGGRIVAPVADSIVVLNKISDSEFKTTEHWGFAFVPLVKD